MGFLRVYLALCVVHGHTGNLFPWRVHDAVQSVQTFYIISGFYMAMVLSSRYSKTRDFYASRLLRIFPAYWVALLGTILLSVVSGLYSGQWLLLTPYLTHPFDRNGVTGVVLTAASNLTLFGQDWVMFWSHESGQQFRLTDDFMRDASPLYHYLLVPQCWSVGVELTFYALAPFLNKLRSRWLVLVAGSALGARVLGYWLLGLGHDPWNYRFFPFELSQFVIGMLGYRLYQRSAPWHPPQRWRCASVRSYLVAAVALAALLHLQVRIIERISATTGLEIASLLSYPFWCLGIPLLFFVFGNQKLDRAIGELSYPVYLISAAIIHALTAPLNRAGLSAWRGIGTALASLALAYAMYRFFIAPLDKKRHLLTHAAADALPQTCGESPQGPAAGAGGGAQTPG